uniref:Uncharacterized protein n=1 Tax=Arundo donax TaxID=35708 RepID=A0A0A8ZU66_ARUDO
MLQILIITHLAGLPSPPPPNRSSFRHGHPQFEVSTIYTMLNRLNPHQRI